MVIPPLIGVHSGDSGEAPAITRLMQGHLVGLHVDQVAAFTLVLKVTSASKPHDLRATIQLERHTFIIRAQEGEFRSRHHAKTRCQGLSAPLHFRRTKYRDAGLARLNTQLWQRDPAHVLAGEWPFLYGVDRVQSIRKLHRPVNLPGGGHSKRNEGYKGDHGEFLASHDATLPHP